MFFALCDRIPDYLQPLIFTVVDQKNVPSFFALKISLEG